MGRNGKKINNNNNFSSVMLLMTVSLALCSNHYNLSDLGENTLLSSSLTYLPLFEYPVVPTLPLLGEVASCSNSSKVSVFIFIKKNFLFSFSSFSLFHFITSSCVYLAKKLLDIILINQRDGSKFKGIHIGLCHLQNQAHVPAHGTHLAPACFSSLIQ